MRFNSKLPCDITLVPRTGAAPYRRVHTLRETGIRRAVWVPMGTCSVEQQDVITEPALVPCVLRARSLQQRRFPCAIREPPGAGLGQERLSAGGSAELIIFIDGEHVTIPQDGRRL